MEEVCALAVPLWFATILALDLSAQARRIGWWTLGITLVVVRVSYHLGQGPSALAHLPWAIATVVLYYRTRQLAPIIVAHFASDLVVNLTHSLHWHSHWQAYTVTAAPTFLAGGVLLLLTRRRARHDPPPITQPALPPLNPLQRRTGRPPLPRRRRRRRHPTRPTRAKVRC